MLNDNIVQAQTYYYPVKENTKKDSLISHWTRVQKISYRQGDYEKAVLYFDSLLEQQGVQINYFSLRIAMYSCGKTGQQRDFGFADKLFGKPLMNEAWHPLSMDTNRRLYDNLRDTARPKIGVNRYAKYLESKLRYPKEAEDEELQGIVYVRFIVNMDGSLNGFFILKGLSMECNQEAIRLIKEGPKWKPGLKNGKAVYTKMEIPVLFSLEEGAK